VVGFVERCRLLEDARERMGPLYEDDAHWRGSNGRQKLGMQRFKELLLMTYPGVELKPRLNGYPRFVGLANADAG
jgi:hypothetical protein